MRNYIERRRASEKGFTLIELLVVIVILGILAAVVVFAVGGIQDKGNTSACKIDTRTIKTAEEAYFAGQPNATPPNPGGSYTNMAGLVNAKLLDAPSTMHDVSTAASGSSGTVTAPATPTNDYVVYVTAGGVSKKCGTTAGQVTNGSSVY